MFTVHCAPLVYKTGRYPNIQTENYSKSVIMTTFQVDDVVKATKALPLGDSERIVLERCGSVKPESHSKFVDTPFEYSGSWKPLANAFLAAVHAAFSNHYPLVLSPDVIWICIAQGMAQHINANPEKLRRRFVSHEGKETLTVKNDFKKGSPVNPWPEAFDQFSQEIKKHSTLVARCMIFSHQISLPLDQLRELQHK